jgi:hypothetical protein
MKPIRWLAGAALFALLAWALIFAYRKGKAERQNEVQREAPVIAPIRVAADSHGVVVRIGPAEVEQLGIRLEPARAVSSAPTVQLNGVIVPDSARIAFLRAPVAGRLEATEGTTWPELASRVTGGTVIAQVADARPLSIPRSGVVTQVGARPGEIVSRDKCCWPISDLSQPLARIAWTEGAPASPPARLVVQPLDRSGRSATAQLVGPSFDVDPVTQRPAFNYRMSGTVARRGGRAPDNRIGAHRSRPQRRGGCPRLGGGAVGRTPLGLRGARARAVRPRTDSDDDAFARRLGGAGRHRTGRSHRHRGRGAVAVRGVPRPGAGRGRGRGVMHR